MVEYYRKQHFATRVTAEFALILNFRVFTRPSRPLPELWHGLKLDKAPHQTVT